MALPAYGSSLPDCQDVLRHLNKESSYKLCQGARYTSPSIARAGVCPSHRGCDPSLPTTLLGASENFLKPGQWPYWVLAPTANPWLLLLLLEHRTQRFWSPDCQVPTGRPGLWWLLP